MKSENFEIGDIVYVKLNNMPPSWGISRWQLEQMEKHSFLGKIIKISPVFDLPDSEYTMKGMDILFGPSWYTRSNFIVSLFDDEITKKNIISLLWVKFYENKRLC